MSQKTECKFKIKNYKSYWNQSRPWFSSVFFAKIDLLMTAELLTNFYKAYKFKNNALLLNFQFLIDMRLSILIFGIIIML